MRDFDRPRLFHLMAASTHRILVVDDEPDITALVAYHLAKAGYRVSTASNGSEALKAAREERPDLVILDLMRGLSLGADDYLTKPFSPAELVLRAQAVMCRLASPAVSAGSTLVVESLVIDRAAMRVSLDPTSLRPCGMPTRTCRPGRSTCTSSDYAANSEHLAT